MNLTSWWDMEEQAVSGVSSCDQPVRNVCPQDHERTGYVETVRSNKSNFQDGVDVRVVVSKYL